MANNCYNLIEFLGNSKVKAQVKKWNEQLATYQPTKEDPDSCRAIKEVFYPEYPADKWPEYGSKWLHQETTSIEAAEDELGLRSAWGSPSEFEKHLACLLYKLDKNVVVRNSFDIEDGSAGVSYTASEDGENAYRQETYVENEEEDSGGFINFENFDDDDGDRVNLKLREEEIVLLNDYFLDDMPHLAKVLKKHLPDLRLDWDSFK